MKIYNEIVIDMNPESSSYRETLHEDSFEYSGPMMLMQNVGDQITVDEDKQIAYYKVESTDSYDGQTYTNYNMVPEQFRAGGQQSGGLKTVYEYPIYTYNEAGGWTKSGGFSESKMEGHQGKISTAKTGTVIGMEDVVEVGPEGEETPFDFTYEEGTGDFDPTRGEFKQYVETTGGYDALATGYGVEGGDFEEFYGAPLEAMEQEYGEGGTLEQGRGLDLDTIRETQRTGVEQYGGVDPITGETITGTDQMVATERQRADTATLDIAGTRATEGLRAATAGAKIGRRSAGLQAGQSLSNIFAQTAAQQEKGGFGPGGASAAIGRKAQRGVMGDYNLQQTQLAEGMTQARSAFGTSQDEIASGRTGVQSAYDISQRQITSGQTGVAETARIDTARTDLAGTQAGIDWTAKKADFWKTTEDEFYDRLSFLESQG